MPNNNKKTGIYIFAVECRTKRRLKGNIREVIELIYPEWKSMSKEDKDEYNKIAKEQHEAEKKARVEAAASYDPHRVQKERRAKITKYLRELFAPTPTPTATSTGASAADSVKIDAAAAAAAEIMMISERFYVVKFMTFCRCNTAEFGFAPPYYVLAEVALVEYSLLDGITDEYHAFIKPNTLPLGYLSKCIEASRDYHLIPYKNFHMVTKTYEQIYKEICQFVLSKSSNSISAAKKRTMEPMIPIFCMSDDIEETRFGLKFLFTKCILAEESNSEWNDSSPPSSSVPMVVDLSEHVYDLECLVVALSDERLGVAQANDVLTKYSFDYASNIKCSFHGSLDTINCALGVCKRKAFLISDHLCPLHGIACTAQHLPVEKPVGDVLEDDEMLQMRLRFRRSIRMVDVNGNLVDDFTVLQPCHDIRYPRPAMATSSECGSDTATTISSSTAGSSSLLANVVSGRSEIKSKKSGSTSIATAADFDALSVITEHDVEEEDQEDDDDNASVVAVVGNIDDEEETYKKTKGQALTKQKR